MTPLDQLDRRLTMQIRIACILGVIGILMIVAGLVL